MGGIQLKKTFQLIDNAYGQPLTLGDLAAAARLMPNCFCRFFQKITHCSPIDYLNYYRIEVACIRLARSDESIMEIALARASMISAALSRRSENTRGSRR